MSARSSVRFGVRRALASAGRWRLAVVLVAVVVPLFALSAAADRGVPPVERLYSLEPVVPPGSDTKSWPFAGGRGVEEFEDAARRAVERKAERERDLASPAMVAKREASRAAHVGVDDAAAKALVEHEFAGLLKGSRADGGLAGLVDGREVAKFLDDHTMVLARTEDEPPALVESPMPLRVADDQGRKRPVDLALQESSKGFEPVNAPADVVIPADLTGGVQVGEIGVVPSGAARGTLSGDDGADRVVYPNAQTDTDVVVAPRRQGAEIFWQLRSPRASEELILDLDLPEGAAAQATKVGSAVVTRDGKGIATISAPVAVDAQGRDVSAAMEIRGQQLVVAIGHRDADVAYPILVDPSVEYYGEPNQGSGWMFQDPEILNGVYDWALSKSGNVSPGQYIQRHHCYATIVCHPDWYNPTWNPNLPDGLHIYAQSAPVSYPAGSWAQFTYEPPGNTTQVEEAHFYTIYTGRNGTKVYPDMYTGIWSATAGWLSIEREQFTNTRWTEHDPNSGALGRRSAVFGMYSADNVTNTQWNDAYLAGAILWLTDPEAPTISGGQLKRKVSPDSAWEDRDNVSRWISPQHDFAIRPNVSDPGLGVRSVVITGPGGINNGRDSLCDGTKADRCPDVWPEAGQSDLIEFDISGLSDGAHNLTINAWDPIIRGSQQTFPIKVDSVPPVLSDTNISDVSGSLWADREQPSLTPEQQPVLAPGNHTISFSAQDVAGHTAAGVEWVKVRVDGHTVSNDAHTPCPVGNCSRSLSWTYNTAEFGGRHKIELVAEDGARNEKVRAFYVNAPSTGDLVYPADGEITSRKIALQAKDNDDDFTGVRFEYRRRASGNPWTTINSHLTDDQGTPVSLSSHALSEPGRHSKKLIWDVGTVLKALVPKETKIQVRAVFTGGPQEFKSRVSDVELDDKGISADNAQGSVGPGSVDLLTGNLGLSATDASLSTFGAPISVTRTFNSLDPNANPNGPLGPGWVISAPLDGVSGYSSLVVLTDASTRDWVDVFDSSGARIRFEKTGPTTFKPQVGFESLTLLQVDDKYTLTNLDGAITTFVKLAGASKFVPSKVVQPDSQGTASYNYEVHFGEPRLKRVVAPAAPGQNCDQSDKAATDLPTGCRVLQFNYEDIAAIGMNRLRSISQVAFNGSAMTAVPVALFRYHTDEHIGRLAHALDPRVSPEMTTVYNYTGLDHRISQITPPGEAPWLFGYTADAGGAMRLDSVSRTADYSGLATWRVRYQVPLSTTAGGPYDLTAGALALWGQADRPTDATAILPPTESGNGYSKATIRYLNQDGRIVNTAAPGGRISVTEYDVKGNAIRELSATNRELAALWYPGDAQAKAAYARTVDTQRTYSPSGLRLEQELGPEHEVKLDSGQLAQARAHTVTSYDEPNADQSTPETPVHLPTTVSTGAKVGSNPDVDVRTTRTEYDWRLRKATKTTIDPGSGKLNIVSQTSYNSAGLTTESRQPKSNGSDAGTTKTIYYGDSSDPACSQQVEWFNWPCKTKPAAQPGTAGLPDLPITTYTYDRWGNVLTATEQVGTASRTTTTTYDPAGRKQTESISTAGSGGGPNGLVAAYGFEEGAGAAVADSSGNANNGTISGATWTASGKYGNALSFDGTNDSVGVPDSNSLDLTSALTLSAWVKLDSLNARWQDLIFKERADNGSYSLDADSSGNSRPNLSVFKSGGDWSFTEGPAVLPTNQWVHLAGTWDGSTSKLYVDGTAVKTRALTGTIPASTGMLRIGGTAIFGSNQFVDGTIDEVRIYNRALSQTEVQTDKDVSISAQTSSGLGEAVPTTTYAYSSTTGRPTTVSAPTGTTTTTGYDNVGRVTRYRDHSDSQGVTSTTTYDKMDRPVETNDGKGSQTRSYDSTTGLLKSLTDSQVGSFAAYYDADGRIKAKVYPNYMVAEYTYNSVGTATGLAYSKGTCPPLETNCPDYNDPPGGDPCEVSCIWVDEQVKESIHGQWRTHSWELSSQEYTYDKAGRLTKVQDDVEAPGAVAGCTIRSYAFDQNSNRTSMNTRSPAGNGDCQPGATGTSKTYGYDNADRLTGTGVQYDKFGRMTSIPAEHSGGGALSYNYYANDQVRTIAQDGISKTYALDPAGRQRQTVATGGTTYTETLHYQDGSDSPSWTRTTNGQGQETWERNVEGLDGDLAAVRVSNAQGESTILNIQNLHGDIVGTASSDPNAMALASRYESDEFGNPRQTPAKRWGWLGGKARRTELASGVIQMGVRSYVPALGRFTSTDPVAGGSATAYDYSNADPVNQMDLTGMYPGEGTTAAERRLCVLRAYNKRKCDKARGLADRAVKATQRMWGTTRDRGWANAYQHCYWNALMTISLGAEFAKKVGDAHEDHPPSPERSMDLNNNFYGRRIAMNRMWRKPGTRARAVSRACKANAAPIGELIALDP